MKGVVRAMEKFPFYTPELDRSETEASEEARDQAIKLLNDPLLINEVASGNVTLAMIRPGMGPESKLENMSDNEAADYLEEEIEGLGVMAKFSVNFTAETTEDFYGGKPKENMLQDKPRDSVNHDSVWSEFTGLMTSGPTTVLLLHSPDGDAIARWREQLGHWNIEASRDENTIRGKFAESNFNNLAHGSDEPRSVMRELSIVENCLQENKIAHTR